MSITNLEVLDFTLFDKKVRYFSNNCNSYFCLSDINKIFNIPDIHSTLRSFPDYFRLKIENRNLNFVSIDFLFSVLFSNSFKKNFKTNNFILDSTVIVNTLISVWRRSLSDVINFKSFEFIDIENCSLYKSSNSDLKSALYYYFKSFINDFSINVDYTYNYKSNKFYFTKNFILLVLSKNIKLYDIDGFKNYIHKKPFSFKKVLEEIEFNLK